MERQKSNKETKYKIKKNLQFSKWSKWFLSNLKISFLADWAIRERKMTLFYKTSIFITASSRCNLFLENRVSIVCSIQLVKNKVSHFAHAVSDSVSNPLLHLVLNAPAQSTKTKNVNSKWLRISIDDRVFVKFWPWVHANRFIL